MTLFVIAIAIALIAIGALVAVQPQAVGAAVSKFYSTYPLVRLAGPRQVTIRNGYMVAIGIVLMVVGAVALAAAMI